MELCKLCNTRPCDNTKAHIIPKWVYNSFLGKGEQFILPNCPVSKPRITQSGIFDYKLVCNQCEKLFQNSDTYSAHFFRDKHWPNESFNELITKNAREETERYFIRHIEDENFDLLKMFVLNTLWRISTTTDSFFSQANLGNRSNYLSKLVLEQSTGKVTDFPFMIFKLLDSPDAAIESQGFMIQPMIARGLDGYWYFRLSLPGFEIHLCTDSRINHGLPEPVLVKPGAFTVVGIPTSQSSSASLSMHVMHSHLKGRTKHLLKKRRTPKV